jgi:FOG: WD40 repeat
MITFATGVVPKAHADDSIVIRRALSEFRDISVWKGRTGLTLFSPDGKYLAVSGKTADVIIYVTETGEIRSKIDGKGFAAFSFSPDSKYAIAQSSNDMSMQIFDVETGNPVRQIRGLGNISNFSKIMGGAGIVNEINGIYPTLVLEMGRVPVTSDWKSILVNKNDKEFAIYDFQSGELKHDIKHANFNSAWETTKIVMSLLVGAGSEQLLLGSNSNPQFSPDGKFLLIANGNKRPTLWNIQTGELVAKFEGKERVFYSRFSPDGRMVATSDFDGITRVWNTGTGELVSAIGSKREPGNVAGWNKDGTMVLVNPTDKADLRAYDPKTGKLVRSFEGSMPRGTVFSHDQSMLVTVPRKDKTILFQVWETETGRLLATAPRAKKEDSPISIKWSPDNSMILTTDGVKEDVKVWSQTGTLVQTLVNTSMPMEFSPDGRYLVTGGTLANRKEDTGYIWEFPVGPVKERLGMVIRRGH